MATAPRVPRPRLRGPSKSHPKVWEERPGRAKARTRCAGDGEGSPVQHPERMRNGAEPEREDGDRSGRGAPGGVVEGRAVAGRRRGRGGRVRSAASGAPIHGIHHPRRGPPRAEGHGPQPSPPPGGPRAGRPLRAGPPERRPRDRGRGARALPEDGEQAHRAPAGRQDPAGDPALDAARPALGRDHPRRPAPDRQGPRDRGEDRRRVQGHREGPLRRRRVRARPLRAPRARDAA